MGSPLQHRDLRRMATLLKQGCMGFLFVRQRERPLRARPRLQAKPQDSMLFST